MLTRRACIERQRLLQLREPLIAQPAVPPAPRYLLQLGGHVPAERLEQPRRAQHVLGVEVLEQLPDRAELSGVGKELDHVAALGRAEGTARIGNRRVTLLLQVVHAHGLAQDQRAHLRVEQRQLAQVALPCPIGMAAALAREMEPVQHRARVRPLVATRPGPQVDEVPELLGRGQRHHLGGVLGTDLQDGEVQLVRRD